jgi:predicted transcriptional regulator
MTPALSLSQRPVRKEDLEAFNKYVETLSTNDRAITFVDCVRKFLQEKQEEEDVDAIEDGIRQADAGLCRPFEEVDARIRAKYGWTANP